VYVLLRRKGKQRKMKERVNTKIHRERRLIPIAATLTCWEEKVNKERWKSGERCRKTTVTRKRKGALKKKSETDAMTAVKKSSKVVTIDGSLHPPHLKLMLTLLSVVDVGPSTPLV
jgi:hypothetical protein